MPLTIQFFDVAGSGFEVCHSDFLLFSFKQVAYPSWMTGVNIDSGVNTRSASMYDSVMSYHPCRSPQIFTGLL
jgi:hypothetical protein